MKTIILATVAMGALLAVASPAQAYWDRGWRHDGYYARNWNRGYYPRPYVYVAPPVVYAPPPVYYRPPPVYYRAPPPVYYGY